MALLDREGHILRANYRIAALLGASPEELLAQHWSVFGGTENQAAIERILQQLLDGSRAMLRSREIRYSRPDGEVAVFTAATSAVVDDGTALLLVQLTDLGAHQQEQATLEGAQRRHDDVAAAVSSGSDAFVATDRSGVITTWTPAMADLLGWAPEEAIGRPMPSLFLGGAGRSIRDLINEAVAGIHIARFASMFAHKDRHTLVALDVDGGQMLDQDGRCIGFSVRFSPHDPEALDARVRWMTAQQRMLSRLRTLISGGGTQEQVEGAVITAIAAGTRASHVMMVDLRDDGTSLRLRTQWGWGPGVVPLTATVDTVGSMEASLRRGEQVVIEEIAGTALAEHPVIGGAGLRAGVSFPLRSEGRIVGGLAAFSAIPGPWIPEDVDYVRECAGMYSDAIQRWADDAERRRLELHDRLTGLPTRTLLVDRLEHALARDRAEGLRTAVIVLDVDHFKHINETLGHEVGDRLIKAVVPRLQRIVEPGDTVGRLSGDEFAIVVGELADEAEAVARAQTVLEAFVEPFTAGGADHVLSVSLGVTLAEADSQAAELLGDADAATFRAKELGRNRVEVFDRSLRDRVTARVATERELRGAAERGELSLRFQPIVDLSSGGIDAFEALVRWEHPERGLVGPGDFIEIAEESGLIVGVGDWVLRTACEQAAEWLDMTELQQPFRLSVNLSARQLADPSLGDSVLRALESSGLPATSLALEVTESVLVEQEQAVPVLSDLRGLGVRILLDDFGTGYSSLSYLRQFEVDGLKIDRSFVSELGERRQDSLLVAALVQMARALSIGCVAEGVETVRQATTLRALGCRLAQGFHFARPLTVENATAVLKAGGVVPGGITT